MPSDRKVCDDLHHRVIHKHQDTPIYMHTVAHNYVRTQGIEHISDLFHTDHRKSLTKKWQWWSLQGRSGVSVWVYVCVLKRWDSISIPKNILLYTMDISMVCVFHLKANISFRLAALISNHNLGTGSCLCVLLKCWRTIPRWHPVAHNREKSLWIYRVYEKCYNKSLYNNCRSLSLLITYLLKWKPILRQTIYRLVKSH